MLAVSALARVEVPAAIWRKRRMGELTIEQTSLLIAEFEADFRGDQTSPPRFAVVSVTPTVLDDAATVAARNDLRAYDAVQLATALATRQADPGCDSFACFDANLREAAARSGFSLVP